MEYDLELEKLLDKIQAKGYKKIVVQLPDGLKTRGKEIVDFVRDNSDCEVIIWAGTCFGACDLPAGIDKMGCDASIQWGHELFLRTEGWD